MLLGVAGAFVLAGLLLLFGAMMKLPDFKSFSERKIVESTKIYDRTGTILLYDVHQDVKRTIIPFEDISPWVKKAVISIEDAEFYNHGAVSLRGLARAILYGGTRGGGSTITQQVVKKTLLTDEKLVTRKLKEMVLSFKLENAYSKDEILNLYLNEIPYGGSVYGIGEASATFFGKTPNELTIAQSAYVAAIPNAPTYYSPYGNNRDKLDIRKNLVLRKMNELGYLTPQEYSDAQKEVVEFLPREPRGIKAPHFVMLIKEYLANKYGELAVEENGYKVTTTLDYDLQQKAEETVAKYGPDNETKFGAKNMGLVAIDPKTGNVLAMVGSRDYFDIKNSGNFNVTLAPNRQPGSTLKPFVYGTAFLRGYTPETVLFDLPTNFSTNCDAYGNPIVAGIKKDDCYMPENYDGKYRGPISMRNALAQSLNVPSVKTLYLAGLNNALSLIRSAGITSLNDPARYGLTLVLGGGEVSLIELTGAYGVLANDGVRNPTTSILRIEDKQGNIIEEFKGAPIDAIPREVTRQITSILSDNEARTPAFGATSPLYFPHNDVAVKTGTTNDYRDVWTVGYTPTIAVGMWAGNNDNKAMQKNVAGMVIAPIWRSFMDEALKLTPSELFNTPEPQDLTKLPAPLAGVWQGGEKYIIDTASGNLATDNTPQEMKKIVVVPNVHTILYWINKTNPLEESSVSPQNDPQFNLWEIPVRNWVASQKITEGDRSGIPVESDTSRAQESLPVLSILGTDFSLPHTPDERIVFTVLSTGKYPLSSVEFYINGQLIDQSKSSPFSFSFTPEDISNISTNNTVTIMGYDSILNKATYTTELYIQ